MNKKISFPHLGDYYIPISYFFEKVCHCDVIIPPKITTKTKKIGSQYCPDYVCSPFKFNIGNYIESLNLGANILFQAGGGCRYGYYAELQEKILRDAGYDFEFVNLINKNKVSAKKMYKFAKKHNKSLNIFKFSHYLLLTGLKVIYMDKIDYYIRENKCHILEKEKIDNYKNNFIKQLNYKSNIYSIRKLYNDTIIKMNKLPEKNTNNIKILIVGELYTLMEKTANCNIEEKLMKQDIQIFRNTNLTYLLLKKKRYQKKLLKKHKKYLKYSIGADGTESVILSEVYAQKKYDGIIHMKSFGCTPEINAMPILNQISQDYEIPILYLTFDILESETNIDNRLEAFCEMIKMKKEKKDT